MNAVIQIENVIYKNPVTSSFQIVTDIVSNRKFEIQSYKCYSL